MNTDPKHCFKQNYLKINTGLEEKLQDTGTAEIFFSYTHSWALIRLFLLFR